jgi:hypothetical protein
MSEQDGFDARLAARFEQEHTQVPSEAFVAATLQKLHASRRRREVTRIVLRAGALVAIVAASPWLIPAVEHLNEAVGSSLSWASDLHGTWVLGALALLVVVGARLRRH